MKSAKHYWIFVLIVGIIFISGCATQEAPIPEVVPEPDVIEAPQVEEELVEEIPEEVRVTESVDVKTVPEEIIEETKCSREFSPQFNSGQYYIGPLFDSHFHMPNLIDVNKISGHGVDHGTDSVTDPVLGKDVGLDKILCNFDKENVRGAIGFSIGAQELLEETLQVAESVKKDSSGKISLFLMPFLFSTESLEIIQDSNKGLFKGYGEIAFYTDGSKPNEQKFLEIYEVAGNNDLIVMFHPDGRQESEIEIVLKKYPNVKFILHGPELENSIVNLINKYSNVYYSLDAILIRLPRSAPPLYTTNSKEEFMSKFKQNYNVMLNEAEKSWIAKIEQHPDRFMWGTDRGYLWHYDEEVSVLIEEFGRAFIGRLDADVQEKFAYENAEDLLANVS